ncbi:DNA repair protein RadA [bacterium]|nr:MAG: DNA repair protein RadA [bacterium]
MTKKRTVFVCESCGASQPKWLGQCPACRAWNTLTRMVVDEGAGERRAFRAAQAGGAAHAVRLRDVPTAPAGRRMLGLSELDRVLGGGVVPGSLVLLGGEPGIGKSTLVLQAASLLSTPSAPVLYVSGEESAEQVKLRAQRMGLDPDGLYLLAETNLDAILAEFEHLRPHAVVVDSIQTLYWDQATSTAGSVTQVRECAGQLMRLAKATHVPVFLVGHVTKAGDLAGPRVLEHMVDVVLYLEGDRFHSYRLLRGVKNRFGSTNEVGVFEMKGQGLVEIPNPSEAFLAERLKGAPGSAVTVTMEGSRPLLVEIQALASTAGQQVPPRRTANGVDLNRLLLLAAVLTKRYGLALGGQDLFVNVVGGLQVSEPAADLAVATAIASSMRGVPIADDLVIIGEIGLSGELRSVGHIERRLAEAAGLGFQRAIAPRAGLRGVTAGGIAVQGMRTLGEALDAALRPA